MSDLRLVDRPVLVPGRCMFTGGNGPCVDFLRDFDLDHDGRIYIGVDFAREIGRYRNDPAAGPGEVRPLRKDNHAVDGLRYAVMARPSVLPSVARSVRRGVPVAGEDVSWGPPRRVRGVSSVGEFL